MTEPVARGARPHGVGWWLGWSVVTALVVAGVYLSMRYLSVAPAVLDVWR